MNKLKQRWGITSNWQLTVILIVFAITGSTAGKVTSVLTKLIIPESSGWILHAVAYIVIVVTIYPIFLVFFGRIFGESEFFGPFARKIIRYTSFGLLYKKK